MSQREEGLVEEEENSSHHHKVEAVVTNLEARGAGKSGEEEEEIGERESGDTEERREREDGVMGGEERETKEGEGERRFHQDMLDRERHSFKQRERQRIVRVS